MFYSVFAAVLCFTASHAFLMPSRQGVRTKSNMVMKLGTSAQSLIGSDLELPEWDPLGFSNNAKPETMEWYRAAELKHGRVAMLGMLGQLFQYYFRLPDAAFQEGAKPGVALAKVLKEKPEALIQIGLAIFCCEAVGQFRQAKPGTAPGDLGWDPLELKSDDPETYAKVQLREIKNGRLAMLALAGAMTQEYLTGKGVLEQWATGDVSPFGDGRGVF